MRMRNDFLGQLALGIRGKRDPRLAGVPGFGQPNVGPGQPQTPGIAMPNITPGTPTVGQMPSQPMTPGGFGSLPGMGGPNIGPGLPDDPRKRRYQPFMGGGMY